MISCKIFVLGEMYLGGIHRRRNNKSLAKNVFRLVSAYTLLFSMQFWMRGYG